MSRRAGSIPEETRAKLLQSAAEEFAEYGFQKSSLRRICANAGVTTGALYFFFQDKEDLFSGVISPVTERIFAIITKHYASELASPIESIMKNEDADFHAGQEILALYYQNKTVCDILLNHRDHPAVIRFFDHLTELMDHQTFELLRRNPRKLQPDAVFNECTVHWFSHLQIDAALHSISHNSDEGQAVAQLQIMIRFLRGGFESLTK
jgi:AcrR family transcriptional regulator